MNSSSGVEMGGANVLEILCIVIFIAQEQLVDMRVWQKMSNLLIELNLGEKS